MFMKILFTGGGTLGPVTPLLAVARALKSRVDVLQKAWVGTPHGPERELVQKADFAWRSIPVARLPRHVSVEWLLLPFRLLGAFFSAVTIMRFERPDVVGSAGGYTAVPVILAAKLFGVKVWVHVQDVEPILTNRLTAPFADVVTVAWEENLVDFPSGVLVGNPVRSSVLKGSKKRAVEAFGLDTSKSTVLVFGGGTGAQWLNEMTRAMAPDLCDEVNVIHVTGRGKQGDELVLDGYHSYELLVEEMADALMVADVVVCRAGLGTITELAALKKAAVMIPLPNSPQEQNVAAVEGAVVRFDQSDGGVAELRRVIEGILGDKDRRRELGEQLHDRLSTDVAEVLADTLVDLTETKNGA